jgi:hypothetical protein
MSEKNADQSKDEAGREKWCGGDPA